MANGLWNAMQHGCGCRPLFRCDAWGQAGDGSLSMIEQHLQAAKTPSAKRKRAVALGRHGRFLQSLTPWKEKILKQKGFWTGAQQRAAVER
eukprot:6202271-Pleurochrysis_carterae.AAC.1